MRDLSPDRGERSDSSLSSVRSIYASSSHSNPAKTALQPSNKKPHPHLDKWLEELIENGGKEKVISVQDLSKEGKGKVAVQPEKKEKKEANLKTGKKAVKAETVGAQTTPNQNRGKSERKETKKQSQPSKNERNRRNSHDRSTSSKPSRTTNTTASSSSCYTPHVSERTRSATKFEKRLGPAKNFARSTTTISSTPKSLSPRKKSKSTPTASTKPLNIPSCPVDVAKRIEKQLRSNGPSTGEELSWGVGGKGALLGKPKEEQIKGRVGTKKEKCLNEGMADSKKKKKGSEKTEFLERSKEGSSGSKKAKKRSREAVEGGNEETRDGTDTRRGAKKQKGSAETGELTAEAKELTAEADTSKATDLAVRTNQDVIKEKSEGRKRIATRLVSESTKTKLPSASSPPQSAPSTSPLPLDSVKTRSGRILKPRERLETEQEAEADAREKKKAKKVKKAKSSQKVEPSEGIDAKEPEKELGTVDSAASPQTPSITTSSVVPPNTSIPALSSAPSSSISPTSSTASPSISMTSSPPLSASSSSLPSQKLPPIASLGFDSTSLPLLPLAHAQAYPSTRPVAQAFSVAKSPEEIAGYRQIYPRGEESDVVPTNGYDHIQASSWPAFTPRNYQLPSDRSTVGKPKKVTGSLPSKAAISKPSKSKGVKAAKLKELDPALDGSKEGWVQPERDMKILENGRPPIWAIGRQELCESLTYFRSYQGGHYDSKERCRGYLLDGFPSANDRCEEKGKIIISHGGGSSHSTNEGYVLHADQERNNVRMRALRNCLDRKVPVVLLAGKNYDFFPALKDLGKRDGNDEVRYAVLGSYWVTDIWAEGEPTSGSTLPTSLSQESTTSAFFVRFKVRFEWVESQGKPWFEDMIGKPSPTFVSSSFVDQKSPSSPSDSISVASTDRQSTPPTSVEGSPPPCKIAADIVRCDVCLSEHRMIYEDLISCYNESCSNFFRLPNGSMPEPSMLKYTSSFLSPRDDLPLDSLVPQALLPPTLQTLANSPTIRDYSKMAWRGFGCSECGRLSSRSEWLKLNCQECGAEVDARGQIVEASQLKADSEPKRPRLLKCADFISTSPIKLDGFEGTSYDLGGGSIVHHFWPTSYKYASCADKLFKEYQGNAAGRLFKRNPLTMHRAQGSLLCQQFTWNGGQEYLHAIAADTYAFEDDTNPSTSLTTTKSPRLAAPCAKKACLYLKEIVPSVVSLENQTETEFNEILSVAYMTGGKMNYHDDGEVGLGPVVASVSLGADAIMSFRPKERKKRPSKAVDSSTVGSVSSIRGASTDAPPPPPKGVALQIKLQHGHIMVMEGASMQKNFEHAVEPEGLRFAATARLIGPDHLRKSRKSSPKSSKAVVVATNLKLVNDFAPSGSALSTISLENLPPLPIPSTAAAPVVSVSTSESRSTSTSTSRSKSLASNPPHVSSSTSLVPSPRSLPTPSSNQSFVGVTPSLPATTSEPRTKTSTFELPQVNSVPTQTPLDFTSQAQRLSVSANKGASDSTDGRSTVDVAAPSAPMPSASSSTSALSKKRIEMHEMQQRYALAEKIKLIKVPKNRCRSSSSSFSLYATPYPLPHCPPSFVDSRSSQRPPLTPNPEPARRHQDYNGPRSSTSNVHNHSPHSLHANSYDHHSRPRYH